MKRLSPARAILALGLALGLALAACDEHAPADPVGPPYVAPYRLVEAFPALRFTKPIDLQDPRDGTNRLFVADQLGVIHVFENRMDVDTATVFLDLQPQVGAGFLDNGEKGLLSIAFDPDYAQNGYFYAYFTSETTMLPGRHLFESRVSRFTVSPPDADTVDPTTEVVILNLPQPHDFHNGGQLAFDAAGYLYLSIGDGGEPKNGQDTSNLFGTLIRIDVTTQPYSIPAGNAFPDSEIFAFGFRNPWRMNIDPLTGRIWVADVGSNRFEEVNLVEVGKNYGWWCREGDYDWPYHGDCPVGVPYEDPLWFYSHDLGTAIIGGYVVRGTALPGLNGRYVCSDYTARELWALDFDGSKVAHEVLIRDTGINLAAFGLDGNGALYMLEWNFLGRLDKIYRVIATPEPAS
jgi:glucose/arabinose dehydrogenase